MSDVEDDDLVVLSSERIDLFDDFIHRLPTRALPSERVIFAVMPRFELWPAANGTDIEIACPTGRRHGRVRYWGFSENVKILMQ